MIWTQQKLIRFLSKKFVAQISDFRPLNGSGNHVLASFVKIVFSIWAFFHEHSRITGLPGKGEGISLTPYYHFHPFHRHLDINRAISPKLYFDAKRFEQEVVKFSVPFFKKNVPFLSKIGRCPNFLGETLQLVLNFHG